MPKAIGRALFPIDFSEGKIAFRVLVSMNRPVSRVSASKIPNLRAKDLIGRKVTKAFRFHKGLLHGTVRRIAEVKPALKSPVI